MVLGFAARSIIVASTAAIVGVVASGIIAGVLLGWGLFCLGQKIVEVTADKEEIVVVTKLPFAECLKKARKQLVNEAERNVREI